MAYVEAIKTLGDIPRHYGETQPDSIALVFEGRRTSYLEWEITTNRIANGLHQEGGRIQERVAYLGKNSDTYFSLLMGTAKACRVMVPLNWRLAPAELAEIIADAEAGVIFVEPAFADLVDELRPHLPKVRLFITLGEERLGWQAYDRWVLSQDPTDPGRAGDPEDVVLQAYTSGTTGRPKGVQLSHRAFYAFDRYGAQHPEEHDSGMAFIDWSSDDVSLVCMPVFHATGTGWGICSLYGGATTVVLPQYDIDGVVDVFASHPITRLVLVPTAIHQLLSHPKSASLDFSSLKYLVYGSSPIPVALLKAAIERIGCGFVQAYGMTETAGGVTYLPASDHRDPESPKLRSAGRPMYGVTITIRDPDGRVLPAGEVGEICIVTTTMMSGYWKQPEETARTIPEEGYLRSGDAGYLDQDGYLFIKDRVKDMIISGGENVYPAEVENAMYGHPAIHEVAVIGVPDERWGEAVKAVVVLKPGAEAQVDDILRHTRERVASYKTPKSIDFVAELPKNATGKVLKRELRKSYWAGLDRQVN